MGFVVAQHQAAQAAMSQRAVADMLAEQGIESAADAALNPSAFATTIFAFERMLERAATPALELRLVESLVQDAGRAAESVSTTVRPGISHTRYLAPPSCARCAVLAGRIYPYSTGFQRHPNCDCVMIPTTTTAGSGLVSNPHELLDAGQVRGLSKADTRAIADGADFNQVVNVRKTSSGLKTPGRVLSRGGRPTPEGIYAGTRTRDEAVQALAAAGYIR